MDLVDTVVCVGCGTKEYRKSVGKRGARLDGACSKCQPNLFGECNGEAKESEQKEEPEGVPKGKPGRA